MFRHMTTTTVGVIHQQHIARLIDIIAQLFEHPLDRVLDRADLRRAELRLRDQLAALVENDTGKIERLVKDRRVGRAHHRHPHLAAGGGEIVVDDGQGDWIN